VTEAVIAMRESTDALQSGRRGPKGRLRKRLLLVAAAGAVAAGVSLALREQRDVSVPAGDGVGLQ
jgi:hypothetical protein